MSDEVVDPFEILRAKCANEPEIRPYKNKLDECTKRVESHPGTTENCQEELFDFLKVLDQCVAPKLLSKLK